jgi:hypothetical protein
MVGKKTKGHAGRVDHNPPRRYHETHTKQQQLLEMTDQEQIPAPYAPRAKGALRKVCHRADIIATAQSLPLRRYHRHRAKSATEQTPSHRTTRTRTRIRAPTLPSKRKHQKPASRKVRHRADTHPTPPPNAPSARSVPRRNETRRNEIPCAFNTASRDDAEMRKWRIGWRRKIGGKNN